jgi:O-antigen/teichoic acid export membrane protein
MTLPTLSGGALLHGGARVVTLALGLALLVAVARRGPEVQGAFALFVAVESGLLALCSGLGLVLAREVSHAGAPPGPLLRGLLRLATGLGLGLGLLLLGWAAAAPDTPYGRLWLLALAAPLLLWVPTTGGLWLGQGRLLALNAPAVAAPALVLAAIAVLSVMEGPAPAAAPAATSVLTVLVAWVAAKVAVAAGAAIGALRADRPAAGARPAPAFDLLRRHGRFVAMVGLTNLVSLLNLRATLFLVERAQGVAAAGVYSVAVQVAELLWVLSSAFTVAAYHRVGGADPAAAARLSLHVVRVGLGLALLAAPVLGALAWWGLPAVLGPAYAAARTPLLILLPGVALYAAASGLSAFHTNLLGRPQWAARVAGGSLLWTLAVALPAIPAWGTAGAALATSSGFALAIAIALHGFLRDQGWGWRALWRGTPTPQSAPA